MEQLKCTECGQVFGKNLDACPNCGCPASECETIATAETNNATANSYSPSATQKPYIFEVDWAHKFYQCSVLFWYTLATRYFKFSGRASRLEFWSFFCLMLLVSAFLRSLGGQKDASFDPFSVSVIFPFFIPLLAVVFRRMHDINKSGWWFFSFGVWFFLAFKKSDEGANKYGLPSEISLENPNPDGASDRTFIIVAILLLTLLVALALFLQFI